MCAKQQKTSSAIEKTSDLQETLPSVYNRCGGFDTSESTTYWFLHSTLTHNLAILRSFLHVQEGKDQLGPLQLQLRNERQRLPPVRRSTAKGVTYFN